MVWKIEPLGYPYIEQVLQTGWRSHHPPNSVEAKKKAITETDKNSDIEQQMSISL